MLIGVFKTISLIKRRAGEAAAIFGYFIEKYHIYWSLTSEKYELSSILHGTSSRRYRSEQEQRKKQKLSVLQHKNMNRTVEGSGTLNTKWKTTIMTATTLKELRTQKAGQQSLHDIRLKSTTFVTFTYVLPLIYI